MGSIRQEVTGSYLQIDRADARSLNLRMSQIKASQQCEQLIQHVFEKLFSEHDQYSQPSNRLNIVKTSFREDALKSTWKLRVRHVECYVE